MNEFNSSTSSFGTDDCYALAAKTRKSTNDERARTVSNARVVVRVRASVPSRANVGRVESRARVRDGPAGTRTAGTRTGELVLWIY